MPVAARPSPPRLDPGRCPFLPREQGAPKDVPQINAGAIGPLEGEIDRLDLELAPLPTFILPAGTRAAATLHLARTVRRRAERGVVALDRIEGAPALARESLNRLSDHLFTLARAANHRAGVVEAAWVAPTT